MLFKRIVQCIRLTIAVKVFIKQIDLALVEVSEVERLAETGRAAEKFMELYPLLQGTGGTDIGKLTHMQLFGIEELRKWAKASEVV